MPREFSVQSINASQFSPLPYTNGAKCLEIVGPGGCFGFRAKWTPDRAATSPDACELILLVDEKVLRVSGYPAHGSVFRNQFTRYNLKMPFVNKMQESGWKESAGSGWRCLLFMRYDDGGDRWEESPDVYIGRVNPGQATVEFMNAFGGFSNHGGRFVIEYGFKEGTGPPWHPIESTLQEDE